MINKRRIIRLIIISFVFAVFYSIAVSIPTGFNFAFLVRNVLMLTVIFSVVVNIVDILFQILLKRNRN